MSEHQTPQRLRTEILVIGGGIMGLWLTWRYTQRGYRVLCLRLNDHERPLAETLRNQGWLQSEQDTRSATLLIGQLKVQLQDKKISRSARRDIEDRLEQAEELLGAAIDMHYSTKEIQQQFGRAVSGTRGILLARARLLAASSPSRSHVEGRLVIRELAATPLNQNETRANT